MAIRSTTEQFIKKAKKVHGNKYDYSLVDYKNNITKVKIVCPKHGTFEQTPKEHKRGSGCLQCAIECRSNNHAKPWKYWKSKIVRIYGDKYSYQPKPYKLTDKLVIICSQHGPFICSLTQHLKGKECPQCTLNNSYRSIRRTREQFLQQARKIHGNKYTYPPATSYRNTDRIIIICPVHGEFAQRVSNHLSNGANCPKCAKMGNGTKYKQLLNRKIDYETFVRRASRIHQNKYKYPRKNKTITYGDIITIVCPKHGKFMQRVKAHLRGGGCPRCAINKINVTLSDSQVDFIKKAKRIHGNKYDYSLVNYKNNRTKIKIICLEHGLFKQTPNSHLSGNGCPKCGREATASSSRCNTKQFVEKARKVHGNKYDYSRVNYKNCRIHVTIICSKHGPFKMSPTVHLSGYGCKQCAIDEITLSREQFIRKAQEIHGDKYDYSFVDYKNNIAKVKIVCPIHGVFEQKPNSHLGGHGCAKCTYAISIGQQHIVDYIKSIYKNKLLINDRETISPFELDIYLPDIKLAIEYNGSYWHSNNYRRNPFYHQKKHLLCKEKGIRLIQIDEHLWKRKRRWFEKLIKDAIEGRPLVYDKSRDTILVDARYDDGSQLLQEGYGLVKLTKPYRIKLKRYVIYDAGRYIYKRNGLSQ